MAVVGAGWWGEQHARVLAGRDDTALCAIVGRRPERAEARARRFGATPYVDLEEMLERERPDLVSLSLPNTEHFAPTLQVLKAGVAVLAEKPLVFDLGEADELLAEADRQGTFFAICFNHRYAKPARLSKAAIDGGRVGEIVFATWRFGGEGSSAHHPHANLVETQCHAFDLLEHLCGSIASVSAELTDAGDADGPGTAVVALRFAGGAVGSLVGSYRSSYSYRGAHLLEVNGTAGRIVVENTVQTFAFQASGSETSEVWRPGYFNDSGRTFTHTLDRYGALHGGGASARRAAARPGHRRSPGVAARAGRSRGVRDGTTGRCRDVVTESGAACWVPAQVAK